MADCHSDARMEPVRLFNRRKVGINHHRNDMGIDHKRYFIAMVDDNSITPTALLLRVQRTANSRKRPFDKSLVNLYREIPQRFYVCRVEAAVAFHDFSQALSDRIAVAVDDGNETIFPLFVDYVVNELAS